MENEKKMYIVVRNDLSASYKMVQGAHALAGYALTFPKNFKEWDNTTIIFLAANNYLHLKEIQYLVWSSIKKLYNFFEPDLDGQLTSFCFYGEGELVKDLPLA